MIGKNSKKNNPTIALDILYTKEKKSFQLIFQILTQPEEKQ